MIDINELRRLAQAAIAKMNASDPEFASSTPPLAILELLDRLEAAEKERDALRTALSDLLNDLEDRAKWNLEASQRVVACGNSVYVQAKAALEATP